MTDEEALEAVTADRLRHSRDINELNASIQLLCRERTKHERTCDRLDRESAALKVRLGIPMSEWVYNERRQDRLAWREQWTRAEEHARCPERNLSDDRYRCSYLAGHDTRWGHETVQYNTDGTVLDLLSTWGLAEHLI